MDSCVLSSSFILFLNLFISVLYIFCLCAKQKLLLPIEVKSSAVPWPPKEGDWVGRGAQLHSSCHPPGDGHLQSPDTASLGTTKKRSLVALFCIFCPCLFSNRSSHPNSGNFLSSQRNWELWSFLMLHRCSSCYKFYRQGEMRNRNVVKMKSFLNSLQVFYLFSIFFRIFIWPLKIFSSTAVAATSIPKP